MTQKQTICTCILETEEGAAYCRRKDGSDMEFVRKTKESQPVLAICYDFDKTLTPDDMQAQGYIQSVGYDVKQFWKETDELAHANGMDSNLAYMFKMVQEAEGNLILNRKALMDYGSRVKLYPMGAVSCTMNAGWRSGRRRRLTTPIKPSSCSGLRRERWTSMIRR